MKAQNVGKAVFYEVNPRYFYDANVDGIGDLKGLAQKFEYFKFLGVNALILQNVLAADSKHGPQSFLNVASEVGSTDELVNIFKLAKKHGISVFLELNIGSINLTSRWFEAASVTKQSPYHDLVSFSDTKAEVTDSDLAPMTNEKTQEFFLANTATQEVPLNWSSAVVTTQFLKVINAWHAQGATGFVLKNFEYLGEVNKTAATKAMSANTLMTLSKFYQAVKQANARIVIIGKGAEANYQRANTYTSDVSRLFDFFYNTHLAMLGTKNNSADEIGNFNVRELATALSIAASNKRNIIAFGSANVGRVVSRWGHEGQFHSVAAKSIAALLLVSPAASLIYYADELGTKNLGLKHVDNFQDQSLEVRKKAKVSARYSEVDFMAAQVLQNPINARSLMTWDASANGGFSTSAKTITPAPDTYQSLNVDSEYHDKQSILQFYRALITLVTTSEYAADVEASRYELKLLRNDLMRVKLISATQTLTLLANFSQQTTKLWLRPRVKHVLHSSYGTKKYLSLLENAFEPFETYLGVQELAITKQKATPQETLAALESKVLNEVEVEQTKPISAKVNLTKTTEVTKTKVVAKSSGTKRVNAPREATQITHLTPVELTGVTSLTSVEKRKLREEANALSASDENYDGATKLRDAQVAKTTLVDVNDADDIEAFLRALDKRRK